MWKSLKNDGIKLVLQRYAKDNISLFCSEIVHRKMVNRLKCYCRTIRKGNHVASSTMAET